MNEDLVDRDLAARLALLIPDVADDGFTRSVMTSLPRGNRSRRYVPRDLLVFSRCCWQQRASSRSV